MSHIPAAGNLSLIILSSKYFASFTLLSSPICPKLFACFVGKHTNSVKIHQLIKLPAVRVWLGEEMRDSLEGESDSGGRVIFPKGWLMRSQGGWSESRRRIMTESYTCWVTVTPTPGLGISHHNWREERSSAEIWLSPPSLTLIRTHYTLSDSQAECFVPSR